MRFLGLIKAAENQGAPPPAMMAAMGKFVEASLKDGSVYQTGGLAPSSAGARIRMSGGKLHFTDGPFAESKEVVGGYAIIEAPDRAAAVEKMRQFMQLHIDHWPGWESECELRELTFLAP